MKTNVMTETVQQTTKPLVNSEVVTPNYPQGYVTTLDTRIYNSPTNLASPNRTWHILNGESRSLGGHRFPGNPGKSVFPMDWSDAKIMEAVSDVATNPNSIKKIQTGNGGYFTKAGNPATWQVIGEYEGIKIKVIIEPAGRGIMTGYPIQ
jgi:filamentous hemagglutinin